MTLSNKLNMADWLRIVAWCWFCTLTFRAAISSKTSHRIFAEWIADLEGRETGEIHWVRMVERGDENGRLHIHALIAGPQLTSTQTAADLWRRLAGTAKIAPYDSNQRGVEYLLKTVEDNPDYDFDFSLPDQTQTKDGPDKVCPGLKGSGENSHKAKNDRAILPHLSPRVFPKKCRRPAACTPPVEFEPLLCATEAASLLRLHPGTLLRWARERRVPHCRLSRKVFFRASELNAWCASGCIMTGTVRAAPTLTGARR
jgi:excisionase family DNA binding protein